MCELCCAATTDWKDRPLPGFYICRATRDGQFMKAGEWGMGIQNSPEFWWAATPMRDPLEGFSDEQLDGYLPPELLEASNEFERRAAEFRQDLCVAPSVGWKLIEAAKTVGYDPEKDGWFERWLFQYLAVWLETHTEMVPSPET